MIQRATALCALLLWAAPALAHEFWLSPTRYAAARGDRIEAAAFAGTGFRGELKPYAAPRTIKWVLRTTKEFDLRPLATNGDLTWASFVAPDAGGAVLAYESGWNPVELPGPEFDRYLALEGLDGPLRERAKHGASATTGRERFARCAKAWIAGSDVKRVLSPFGLTLELVPLDPPGTSDRLRVKLLYRGRPLAGAKLRAFRQPLAATGLPTDAATRDSLGVAFETRTDRAGLATVPVAAPGEWLVSAVHMVPCDDRAAADWQSYWASLSFARGGR